MLGEIISRTEERVAAMGEFPVTTPLRVPRSLKAAILSAAPRAGIIAELKAASPSRGCIREGIDVEPMVEQLTAGGCIALSILTEPFFFGGSPETLIRATRVSRVPLLRKDFIIDEQQLVETALLGADAVLLIAAVLGDRLPDFVNRAYSLGLEPLVEIHSRDEAELALTTSADLIGINNRDLETMKTSLNTTKRLSAYVREEGRLVVSESGIIWPYNVKEMKPFCDAFLIGTAIMSSRDPRKKLEGFVFA